MSVTGFLVNNEVQKYDYESLENYNTPDFSTSSTYQVGDYVMYQGKLYKCITAITTGGAWDSTKWSLAILSDDVADFKSAIEIIVSEAIDVTTGEHYPVLISANNGKWVSASGRRSYFYPMPSGATRITVVSNADNRSVFTLLKDNGNKTGTYPNYATGYSKIFIPAGETMQFDVPDDGNYIYLLGYFDDVIYTPQSVVVDTVNYTDTSLTLHGKSADAKATGDAIRAIEIDTEQLSTELFPAESEFPLDILHRGLATIGYPQNTIPAYKDAVAKGWKYLETDIRFTSDSVPVLLHDADINSVARNADGTTIAETVYISNITYEQALTYDFGISAGPQFAGTKITTLDGFINYCQKSHVFPILEIKNSLISQEQVDIIWDILKKYQMQNRVIWLCSSLGGVEKFLEKNPYAPCIQTSSTTWEYVDISTLTPERNPPYAASFKTGKNKVFHEHSVAGITSKELMDNLVDFYHFFGIFAGVYSPTTETAINACSERLDACTTQYLKYSDVKANAIDY